jgi:hypothetical protein
MKIKLRSLFIFFALFLLFQPVQGMFDGNGLTKNMHYYIGLSSSALLMAVGINNIIKDQKSLTKYHAIPILGAIGIGLPSLINYLNSKENKCPYKIVIDRFNSDKYIQTNDKIDNEIIEICDEESSFHYYISSSLPNTLKEFIFGKANPSRSHPKVVAHFMKKGMVLYPDMIKTMVSYWPLHEFEKLLVDRALDNTNMAIENKLLFYMPILQRCVKYAEKNKTYARFKNQIKILQKYVNETDRDLISYILLDYAVLKKHIDIVKILLEDLKIDPNIKNGHYAQRSNGISLLHRAIDDNSKAIVKLFVENGANLYEESRGKTLLGRANILSDKNIYKLIEGKFLANIKVGLGKNYIGNEFNPQLPDEILKVVVSYL